MEIYIMVVFCGLTLGFLGWFWFSPRYGVLCMKARAEGEIQVDTRFYYSAETLYRLFDKYGADGRRDFRVMLWVDMVFPLVYGPALCLLADVMAQEQLIPDGARAVCIAATLVAVLFDYVENIALLRVLRFFPAWRGRAACIARGATTVKMAATNGAVLALACGAGFNLFLSGV